MNAAMPNESVDRRAAMLMFTLVTIVAVSIYFETFSSIVRTWNVDGYSHGFIIIPICVYLSTQNKILESMSMGVPVVSSVTAAGGVDAIPEQHILIADNADAFSRKVLRLLDNAGERMAMSSVSRKRMMTHHNWDTSMTKLDDIVGSALRGNA